MLSKSIQNLIDQLSKLPGIGPRQATRIAYHILKKPAEDSKALAESIISARKKIRACPVCFLSYEPADAQQKTCKICADKKRTKIIICVVEKETDAEAIESSGLFRGVYHVVGEEVDVLDKNKQSPTIKRLLERIAYIQKQLPPEKQKEMEIILATNANVEGDALALYLENIIKPLGARVARLGRGLASGAELEYADKHTLMNAMESRK